MTLAIFDLDNTLIAGDSDHAWGEFLCERGYVDASQYQQTNDQFYEDYKKGELDIYAYQRFALSPLKGKTPDELAAWRYLEAWDQAKFGLRLGSNPQAIITTTPKPLKVLRDLWMSSLIAMSTSIILGSTLSPISVVVL